MLFVMCLLQAKKGTNYEALKEESDVFKAIKFPSKCSVCGEGKDILPGRDLNFESEEAKQNDFL